MSTEAAGATPAALFVGAVAMTRYVSVAVPGPLKKTFTYFLPASIPSLSPGQRLLVPFGRTRMVGFFLGPAQPVAGVKIKPIIRAIDTHSYFSRELFEFCIWMADYYFANPADCLIAALPSVFKKNRPARLRWTDGNHPPLPETIAPLSKPGKTVSAATAEKISSHKHGLMKELVEQGFIDEEWPDESDLERRSVAGYRAAGPDAWTDYFSNRKFQPQPHDGVRTRAQLKASGWSDHYIRGAVGHSVLIPVHQEDPTRLLDFILPRENLGLIQLNEEQQAAFDRVRAALDTGFKSFLLHGITGSGKTIVYCHLCREVLDAGRTALVLTPEIALTSTTLAYFRGFFGDTVTVIHSAMTDKERLESWRGIRQGRYKIVLGPRSAVFAPLKDPGLIIVDEEHDSSYKQDDPAPRFHGRDSAVMRARINEIPILLGSASPSMESYHNAVTGRYELLELTRRPGNATLPIVRIVDMRKDRIRGDLPYVSWQMKKEVESRLALDQQVILYLNRRGHSPQLKCADCGHVATCPNCSVRLTYHRVGRKISCHYCGYLLTGYDTCAKCGGTDLLYLGVGTQKVEENIPRLFNGATATRLDSDSAAGRQKAYQILADFSQHKSNLLLGTQMVTKGLDLPDVTLVGVLSADMSLDLPDFRASEKTFARLLQVAGRSGRAEVPGEVLIQTFYPESDVIHDAARQDYRAFYEREIESRKSLAYPPFTRIINFILATTDEKKLEEAALCFAGQVREKAADSSLSIQLLGPAPCPLYYLRGKYRRHLLVKTRQAIKIVRMLVGWEASSANLGLPSSVRLIVDVDADDMM